MHCAHSDGGGVNRGKGLWAGGYIFALRPPSGLIRSRMKKSDKHAV